MARQKQTSPPEEPPADREAPRLIHEQPGLALSYQPSLGPLVAAAHTSFQPGDGIKKRKPTFLYGPGGKRIPVFPGEDDAEIARLKAQGWEFTPKD